VAVSAGIKNARRAARELLARCGVTVPQHVVVEDFAARLGIRISVAPLSGATAQLVVPRWGRPMILLSDRLLDPAERRFAVAHELGHYVLEHPSQSLVEMCTPGAGSLAPTGGSEVEREANAFAAELLMPESLVRLACDVTQPSMEMIFRIAYTFGTSVPASAIRFTELTEVPCAVVLSAHGAVRWTASSATFSAPLDPGKAIDPRSLAWDYFADGTLSPAPRAIPAAAWLDASAELPLMEHSIASHARGTVLTMLWEPSATVASWSNEPTFPGSPSRTSAALPE
jgi:IrrE N-terminal-like domain